MTTIPKLIIKKSKKRPGSPPGTIVYTGDDTESTITYNIIDFSDDFFQEQSVDLKNCIPGKDSIVRWINVNGINNVEMLEHFGVQFQLHPLTLEDIANINSRPKLEEYDNYIFFVMNMLYIPKDSIDIQSEQISIILGKGFVLSFQEREGDVFEPIRQRLRSSKGFIRKEKADYLTYALIDAIVDNYYVILERVGEKIEDLEFELVNNPNPETLQTIHSYKKEMLVLRKSVWPLREVISKLGREEISIITRKTNIYLRDVYDHTIQVIDNIETYRDLLSGMLDIYLSSISNRMNEIMKVLTIIGSIFIPISFITGLYGMNFKYIPELDWPFGYLYVWVLILSVVSILLIYFKKKKFF